MDFPVHLTEIFLGTMAIDGEHECDGEMTSWASLSQFFVVQPSFGVNAEGRKMFPPRHGP
jgi:hypothetical protein